MSVTTPISDDDRHHPRLTPSLLGHEHQQSLCRDLIREGRLPHALLFQGPKGIGKATFAYHLIRYLFAGHPSPDHKTTPLEKASLTLRPDHPLMKRVASLGHGDLKVIERLPDEKGKLPRDITVQQIRDVISFFSKKSMEGGWRIALVDSVDEMNPQAGNALLKILEEPPQRCLLILINHTPGRLLPTLSSRCRKISFRALSSDQTREVVQTALSGVTPKTFDTVYPFSAGSPGKALLFLNHFKKEQLQALETVMKDMVTSEPFDPFPFLDTFFSPKSKSTVDLSPSLGGAFQEWLYTLIQKGATQDLSPPLQAFFQRKSPLEWITLYTELSTLFEEKARLSYQARHVFLCALMKITQPSHHSGA